MKKERERTEMVFVEENRLIFIHCIEKKRRTFFQKGADVPAEAVEGMQIESICACLAVFLFIRVRLSLSVDAR